LQDLERGGPLQRHESRVAGNIVDLHIHAERVLEDVVIVLFRFGNVDHPAEVVLAKSETHQVVDDGPILRAHDRIHRLVDGELAGVVCGDLLHQRECVAADEVDLAHVRHVAQCDALARRLVFRDVATIVHGTREAFEVDDGRSVTDMVVEERGAFHVVRLGCK
jgi:hypothetical protein